MEKHFDGIDLIFFLWYNVPVTFETNISDNYSLYNVYMWRAELDLPKGITAVVKVRYKKNINYGFNY